MRSGCPDLGTMLVQNRGGGCFLSLANFAQGPEVGHATGRCAFNRQCSPGMPPHKPGYFCLPRRERLRCPHQIWCTLDLLGLQMANKMRNLGLRGANIGPKWPGSTGTESRKHAPPPTKINIGTKKTEFDTQPPNSAQNTNTLWHPKPSEQRRPNSAQTNTKPIRKST